MMNIENKIPAQAADAKPDLVRRACRLIDGYDEEGTPTLAYLGERLGVSPFHLQRTFKKALGVSPREYAEAARLDRFKDGVRDGRSVTEAMYDAGFGAPSRLYENARRRLGMTPASYGKGGKGANITYAIADTHLGRMLVAVTEFGLCKLCFGDDDEELTAELAREFPKARRSRDDDGLDYFVNELLDMMREPEAAPPDIPLDVHASAFQARVWSCLIRIPPGEVRTYGDIAAELEMPRGARAVGAACGANPVAVVIPCHRVVAGDGALRGYRWGIERKRKLLEAEGARSAAE